ncbi:bacterioferritin [Alkalilimnicola ehrlichii MLHE-1]|uniref:Bacterioferritin n=1 Tax=Alkalilimnicola ehrlichii (strain ATCC BAA-1101 / DSM 17681 / MLHE-1) TaxID=187272 RepID=Q0ABK3_ALKEH|nr:bacterioferritin [Alkalilimnicola ehrlichii]ABI55784.1 bacterioferritin [Alkalilimnicola ehrlichii MLHE-1]
MQGDKKVIEYLNQALKLELTAINQYFLHSRIAGDWGLTKLEEKEYEESIDEMKHADEFIQRILFLGGMPNLQDYGRLRIGENVREILQADLEGEHEGRKLYQEAAGYCDQVQDYVTRDLFKTILADEEGHIDWLETQLDLMDRVGEQNYQQSLM